MKQKIIQVGSQDVKDLEIVCREKLIEGKKSCTGMCVPTVVASAVSSQAFAPLPLFLHPVPWMFTTQ